MYFEQNTNVTIAHNVAKHTGGGIYIETGCLISTPMCFFQCVDSLKEFPRHINVSVNNNLAMFGGNNIFGGSIDRCYMTNKPHFATNIDMFEAMFSVSNDSLSISSPPRRVCLCQDNTPNCTLIHRLHNDVIYNPLNYLEKFPGETFSIEAVLVGQFRGSVPGTVQAWLKPKYGASFGSNEQVQKIQTRNCTKLNYTIFSRLEHVKLELGAQPPGDIGEMEQLGELFRKHEVNVTLKDCPLGFSLTTGARSHCACDVLFRQDDGHISCDIKHQTIKRTPPVWIGYIEESNNSKTLAYHSQCPLDYCVNKETFINVYRTESFHEQCAFNRTGTLCGMCSQGLSAVLGSSLCLPCSNYWLALLIPFALTGVLMIIILTLCNITVAEGTLGGIIFYCNILVNNLSIFVPGQGIPFLTSALKAFILMINMDTGMTLCFFQGMDEYIKAWLNFVFPLYIWLITGVLIWLGGRCSWIVRHNAVKVLATLVLLSYARLLNAIAGALQVSTIHLPNGRSEKRWLIDGNIHYLKGKHIPLATFAILFSLTLLPFTLSLLFIQYLQKVSHSWAFSWVNHLKPFFDAYTGPFTSTGRFWTGLLLLSRGILLTVSAVNTSGNPSVVLSATCFVVTLLLGVAWIIPNGLYQKRSLNTLESLCLVNLSILSSLLLMFPKESKYSIIISHMCVGIIFLTFIAVIMYHISGLKPVQVIFKKFCCCKYIANNWKKNQPNVAEYDDPIPNGPNRMMFAEDREPLLASIKED